jgi:phosphoribosyl-AMP cyclohydrolase / phosphoribosyl-ATP pyrophosphohydrolase
MSDMETQQVLSKLRFDGQGLIPVVVQDVITRQVLTVAYMNRETLERSVIERETYFWSRSRREVWHKGATSGNSQKITRIEADCDGDALLVWVEPRGPACHTGAVSCFFDQVFSDGSSVEPPTFSRTVERLVGVIKSRQAEMPEGSYTSYLFARGIDKILKKIGEEAAETIIAAKNRSTSELVLESADLLYHLLVLFVNEGLQVREVLEELDKRAKKDSQSS